jgi:DNA-binding protein H-NS
MEQAPSYEFKPTTSVFAKGKPPSKPTAQDATDPDKDKTPPAPAPAASPVDLARFADAELTALIAGAQQELEARHARREAEFLTMVREQAAVLNIPPARLAVALGRKSAARPHTSGATDGRSVVKPKYWCVTDHALRWSGRGAQPKWFADHIAAGGKEADMSIPEGER